VGSESVVVDMPFVDKVDVNFPVVVTREVPRLAVENVEEPRAIESSQEFADSSDAVVVDLSSEDVANSLELSRTLSNQETSLILESVALENSIGNTIRSGNLAVDSYQMADRLHRLPVYGTLVIDVYV